MRPTFVRRGFVRGGLVGLTIGLAMVVAACGDGGGGEGEVASDCKPKHEFETHDESVLTISGENVKPLFGYRAGQPLEGIEGAVLTRFAERECLKTKVLVQGEAGVLPTVTSGRADVATGGSYITPERLEVVDFADPTYIDYPVFVSKAGYSTVDSLKGKKVGTVTGYPWVERLQKVYGKDNVKLYQSAEAEFNDLFNGRVDAIMDGLTLGAINGQKDPSRAKEFKVEIIKPDPELRDTMEPGRPALPYTKGNDALGKALSDNVNEMRESGELAKLFKAAGLNPEAADTSKLERQ